jgi:hypothetical protein
MGLAKANELLVLRKKIDAETPVDWNICFRIVEDVDLSGDLFHPKIGQICAMKLIVDYSRYLWAA